MNNLIDLINQGIRQLKRIKQVDLRPKTIKVTLGTQIAMSILDKFMDLV